MCCKQRSGCYVAVLRKTMLLVWALTVLATPEFATAVRATSPPSSWVGTFLASAIGSLIGAIPIYLWVAGVTFLPDRAFSWVNTLCKTTIHDLASRPNASIAKKTEIITLAGDEAGGLLRTTQFLTWLIHLIWGRVWGLSILMWNDSDKSVTKERRWFICLWILAMALWVEGITSESTLVTMIGGAIAFLPFVGPVVLTIAALPLALLIGLFSTVSFGIAVGVRSILLDISSDSVPPGTWNVTSFEPSLSSSGVLSHSLYDDPRVVERLVEIVRRYHQSPSATNRAINQQTVTASQQLPSISRSQSL